MTARKHGYRPVIRTKTVSLHYKRKRADAVCNGLNAAYGSGRSELPEGYPAWTDHFEVRRARTRFHYKVVAVGT
jgi:hypothetical protein